MVCLGERWLGCTEGTGCVGVVLLSLCYTWSTEVYEEVYGRKENYLHFCDHLTSQSLKLFHQFRYV